MKQNSQEHLREFSRRLRKAMGDMHMTATELVNATGIDKSNISHYCHGKYLPKHARLYKMASALNVRPEWLYAIDDDVTADIKETVQAMDRQLDEIDKGIEELRKGYKEFERGMNELQVHIDIMKANFDKLDRLRGEAGA